MGQPIAEAFSGKHGQAMTPLKMEMRVVMPEEYERIKEKERMVGEKPAD